MDLNEIILKLPESQKREFIEKLLSAISLQNSCIDTASKDSAGKSEEDVRKSVNLSNSTPEKSLKQKTLDNWIVKSKTSSSNREKEVAKELGETSRNVESEEGKKLEKSNKLDNAINKKKLMVLLNREDCLETVQKSPDNSKLSSEKKLSSPINIISPIKKDKHVSENFDQQNVTPEQHSPILTRSYNLRARGVIDEKICDETNNSMASLAECKDSDKILKPIHKSASKQKQKLKTSLGKDVSSNSSFEERDYDQKTNSCNNKISIDNITNSECKISPTLTQSDSETLVDSNKVNVTDENPTVVVLDPHLLVKGKRKRAWKDKVNKVCTSSAIQKSLDNQESEVTELNENNKRAEYVTSKKLKKLSVINADSSALTNEKTAQLPGIVVSASPSREQTTTNNIIKSVSELKSKKTNKSKVKSNTALHKKIKLDSVASNMEKKNLTIQEINSDITMDIGVQRISDEQLESTKNSKSQIKVCTKETEKLLTKDVKSVTAVNEDSKRISRKRGCEIKRMVTTENSSLYDQEPTSKDKDCTTSINFLSKMSPSENKEFVKGTNELFIKETNTVVPINAKKMCKKKGKVSVKNSLILDLEKSSKNNNEVSITSFETSSIDSLRNLTSQSNKFPKSAEEPLIKDIDAVIQLDRNSTKILSKKSNDNMRKISTKRDLISESEHSLKSNAICSFTFKTSSVDCSKNSLLQSKEFVKNSEEPLIEDTPTLTTFNIKSKKVCTKKSYQNKVQLSSKTSLVVDPEETFKNNEMGNISPSKISSFDSSKNSSQSKEATEDLLNIEIQKDTSSKRIYRKKGSENKSKVVAKINSEPASKNCDKDNIISTSTDSSNNSPFQNKKFAKKIEELLIEDTTTITPSNLKSKKICRKKNNKNKIIVATKNNLKSDSEQIFKNNGKNNINSIETLLMDSSEISITKDILPKQISSADTEGTIFINQNCCSKPISAFTLPDDHRKKNSKLQNGDSHNELIILNEMKEIEDDLSKKSNAVSLNGPQTNDNIQESSQVSHISKKGSTLKKESAMQLPTNSKKKLKIIKDENHLNVAQSRFYNLSMENENSCLIKTGSKKTMVSTKIKLGSDSNREHLDALIAKSTANSLHSNGVQELKDHLKNSKVKTKFCRAQKKTVKLKNSKKVKESHSKKVNNSESQIICNSNLSKNYEMENLNCNLDNEISTKNKHKSTSLSMIKIDNSEGEKENHDIIKNLEGKIKKVTEFIVNNSNNTGIAEINCKDSVELDEKMKHNYEAFCRVKEVLKVIGICIEELFENQDMINSLKSVQPDGVYLISKCKSDSKISVHTHESKKELRNILSKLKNKYDNEDK